MNIEPYLEPIGHINEILDCMFSFMDNHQLYNGPLLVNKQWYEIAERYIDPAADNQRAICWAFQYGDLTMIDRLLADPRVGPLFDKVKVLELAAGRPDIKFLNKCLEILFQKIPMRDDKKELTRLVWQLSHTKRHMQVQ
jgi:hypothetical protein